MRIRAYIGLSVDGFVAARDSTPVWGDRFDPRMYGYGEFIQQIAVAVMGRATFDQAIRTFGLDWPWKGMEVYVLTSRPLPADSPKNATAWREGPAALLVHLRSMRRDGDTWVVGGPRTIRAFLDSGSFDQIALYVLPILLGDGIPLFVPGATHRPLRLEGEKAFGDGTVELVYSPA